MSQVSAVLRRTENGYSFWCPACGEMHAVRTDPGGWTFNGNVDRPTFFPSIRVRGKQSIKDERGECCHSWVENGAIRFLCNCTHALAGKTVPLPPLPDWLKDAPA